MEKKIRTIDQNRSIFHSNRNENIKIVCKYFCLHINALLSNNLGLIKRSYCFMYVLCYV
jgi:hypothetical protein